MERACLAQNMSVLRASVVAEELVRNGLDTFFVSPGNRNAPLIAAITGNPRAHARSVMDERGAGFAALGHAKATGRAGVLVCTSGTALSNYFPAVIEAFRDELPLVVLSSDRPAALVFSDANQTMQQPGIFGGFIRKSLFLPPPDPAYPIAALAAHLDDLLRVKNGPVHINCPFRDPLVPLVDPENPVSPRLLEEAREYFAKKSPQTVYAEVSEPKPDIRLVRAALADTRRGLLSIGRLESENDRKAAAALAQNLGWPVFCDVASSVKALVPPGLLLPCPDHPGARALYEKYGPETVLQLGTGFVSKHYYQAVLAAPCLNLILVSPRSGSRDPSNSASLRIPATVAAFAEALGQGTISAAQDLGAAACFLEEAGLFEKALYDATPSGLMSFPLIARTVNRLIPSGEALFLGNSSTIRAFDAEGPPGSGQVLVVSNRGVSGIEGNIATSVGYAEGSGKRVTAVIGDVSFLHDVSSLLMLSRSLAPVILIVANNRGGRIFEKLPVSGFPEICHPLMTTPHDTDISMVCGGFGLIHQTAGTPEELGRAYSEALSSGKTRVIEAVLDPETDLTVFEKRKTVR